MPRIPKRAKEDKLFPFLMPLKKSDPKAFRRYLRRKRFEPLKEKLPNKGTVISLIKWILVFASGIIATIISQYFIKMLNL